jgi:hypothetical protein
VNRRSVLALRALRHGLVPGTAPDPAVLDLGVQDTPVGSARLALSARSLPEDGLTMVWSFRGGPHLQRSADLASLAAALLPLSDDDAAVRLAALGAALKKAGSSPLEAVLTTAAAVRSVVRGRTVKSDLSAGVTAAIPEAYSSWCRGCGSTHVNDLLLRLATLPGGARIVDQAPLTVEPIPRWQVPTAARDVPRLVRAYLALHGPASVADAASYLGTSGPRVRSAWPADLVPVTVEGRTVWALDEPPDEVPEAPFVRLLGHSDPYLQMRDRATLVPDRARAKTLWTVLSGPGALVVDGEVAGTWRATRKKRLDVVVTPWTRLSAATRSAVEEEAARVASVRGVAEATVGYA